MSSSSRKPSTNPPRVEYTRSGSATRGSNASPAGRCQRPGGTFLVIKGPDRGEQVALSNKPVTFGSAEIVSWPIGFPRPGLVI